MIKQSKYKSLSDLLNKDLIVFKPSFGNKSKEALYSELCTLISSGISLRKSIELLITDNSKKNINAILDKVLVDIIAGYSFSDAMRNQKHFTEYETISIQVGEESGKIVEVLDQLAFYYKMRIKLKRQLISVLSYPFFLISITMGVLIFMLSSVVPMFKEIFLRFDKELPPFTQSVLDLSDWFKSYGLFMFLLIIVLFFVVFSQRKKLVFRKYSADVVLKIPIVGGLVRKVYLARLCQSMALLISSKVPLIRTLELMQGIISYYPLELALSNIIRRVEKGESLANSMQEHDVFDKKMVTLIRVAEETNSLDKMLSRLANQYNESIEHSSSTIGTLIEPIMILLVGLIVGIILVAMYQPLFNIGNILE